MVVQSQLKAAWVWDQFLHLRYPEATRLFQVEQINGMLLIDIK